MLLGHYLGVPACHYYPSMVFRMNFGWYLLNCLMLAELDAMMAKELLSEDYFVAAGLAGRTHC